MTGLEHYLYVLECGDGSLYTGYAPNVQERLAKHRAGKGAKYTKSHEPVKLVAQARFYSKARAMSAEAYFKKLDRKQKDALIARSKDEPFEDVLRRELPGFPEDTACEFVSRSLFENCDPDYKTFHSKLVPNIDPSTIIGVRTPVLRKIAKELAKRDDVATFLNALPHDFYDQNQVHAFVIGCQKDYDKALELYDAFLPFIDNWATCDQLPVTMLAKDPERTLEKVDEWLASGKCYTIRFGMGVLMRLYLDDLFQEEFLVKVAQTHMPDSTYVSDGLERSDRSDRVDEAYKYNKKAKSVLEDDIYYVNMMRAWYFAEALAKQERAALPYFELKGDAALLDEWTRRKAIQKAIESRRISDVMKNYLRQCK